MRRSTLFLAVLALAGCGGRVVFDPPGAAGDAGTTAAKLPAVCEAFVEAVDWTECAAAPVPDPRAGAGLSCAQWLATPTCEDATAAYYECVAAHAPTCTVYDGGAGAIGETYEVPECDALSTAFSDCLSKCGGGYSCDGEGWEHCACESTTNPGAACDGDPTTAGALPSCSVLCSACSPK